MQAMQGEADTRLHYTRLYQILGYTTLDHRGAKSDSNEDYVDEAEYGAFLVQSECGAFLDVLVSRGKGRGAALLQCYGDQA